VDLFVNGKCIARGDVVVIEDNFGVRITEILQKPGVEDIIQK
jgi:flagellar motor switch protein FliN/FliY